MVTTDQYALATGIAHARNYSIEATMGDYSMDSIDRAQRQLAERRAEVEASPFKEDDLIDYVDGAYRVKLPITIAELKRKSTDPELSQESRDHYARQLAHFEAKAVVSP